MVEQKTLQLSEVLRNPNVTWSYYILWRVFMFLNIARISRSQIWCVCWISRRWWDGVSSVHLQWKVRGVEWLQWIIEVLLLSSNPEFGVSWNHGLCFSLGCGSCKWTSDLLICGSSFCGTEAGQILRFVAKLPATFLCAYARFPPLGCVILTMCLP